MQTEAEGQNSRGKIAFEDIFETVPLILGSTIDLLTLALAAERPFGPRFLKTLEKGSGNTYSKEKFRSEMF